MNYEEMGQKIGKLVQEKQKAYGDSFGKSGEVLKIFFPDGVKPEQYDNLLCITRILDKLFRIATEPDAFGESPYSDIAGYGLLGAAKKEKIPKYEQEYRFESPDEFEVFQSMSEKEQDEYITLRLRNPKKKMKNKE